MKIRVAFVVALLVALTACAIDPAAPQEEQAASTSEALFGAYTSTNCAGYDAFILKALNYGRFVSQTSAFASCVQNAPYRPCHGYKSVWNWQWDDPPDDNEDPAALLPAMRSTNAVSVNCDTNMKAPDAGDFVEGILPATYGNTGPETFNVATWNLDLDGAQSTSPPTLLHIADAAKILWHEAMHAHGYHHGSNDGTNAARNCGYSDGDNWVWNVNSAPYIASACMDLMGGIDFVAQEFGTVGQALTPTQLQTYWNKIEAGGYGLNDLWNDAHTIPFNDPLPPKPGHATFNLTPLYRVVVPSFASIDVSLTGISGGTPQGALIQVTDGNGGNYFGTRTTTATTIDFAIQNLRAGTYFITVQGDLPSYAISVVSTSAPTGCYGSSFCPNSSITSPFTTVSCDALATATPPGQLVLQRSDSKWDDVEVLPFTFTPAMTDLSQPTNVASATYRVCLRYPNVDKCGATFDVTYDNLSCSGSSSGGGSSSSSGSGLLGGTQKPGPHLNM
jgi:hypothetical protein